jgi:HSP20 family protein
MSETSAVQRAKEPVSSLAVEQKLESPLDRMNAILDEIAHRAFEIFESHGRVLGHHLEDWSKAEQELLRPVNIEMTESEGAFEIKAEVPGFTEKELEISVEPRRVVIVGKHEAKTEEQKKGKVICSETRAEQMLRVVELPGPIETAKVTAALLKNGILKLTLPKVATQAVRIKPTAP